MLVLKRSLSTSSNFYDITIVGGGMIGSVLANTLAKNPSLEPLSILLIESSKKKTWNSNEYASSKYSNRVSSLNNSTKSLLQSLGIWDSINSVRCKPVKHIKVWGHSAKNIATDFDAQNNSPNAEPLSYIVENDVLIGTSMEKLEAGNRVDILYDTSVHECILPQDDYRNAILNLSDGRKIESKLLLGCDGANSKIRQAMGVQYLKWNYNQRAIVATLKLNEVGDNNTAWQKFISTGPIALLPLNDDHSSLVWSTTPENAKVLLSLDSDSFVDALNSALWDDYVADPLAETATSMVSTLLTNAKLPQDRSEIIPPSVTKATERASFPLGFGHAVNYVQTGVALVGDAAHRVHPLAGQGVNLGFGDVECLNEVLSKHIPFGTVLGSCRALTEYQKRRQRRNIPMLIGIDLMQRVIGHPWSPFLAVTNVGFQVVDAIPPLKKFLVNNASS